MTTPMATPMATHQRRTVATACRICAVACGTLVELDGDDVIRVTGDFDDPWSKGYMCSKGRAGPEFHRDPIRLDVPQIRRNGELVDVTWDQTLDDLAALLHGIVAEYGPAAVASYTGTGGPLDPSGYAMAHGFFRAVGTDQMYSALSIDCAGKFLVPQLVAGVQMQFQPDLANTDLLLAVGVNTVVSHGHGLMMPNPIVHLRDLRARGGRVVVVDPRRTETTHHADLHLAVRPGTDPALLAFAVRHVLHHPTGPRVPRRVRRPGRRRAPARDWSSRSRPSGPQRCAVSTWTMSTRSPTC